MLLGGCYAVFAALLGGSDRGTQIPTVNRGAKSGSREWKAFLSHAFGLSIDEDIPPVFEVNHEKTMGGGGAKECEGGGDCISNHKSSK